MARKLFAFILLVCGFVFCFSSYADDKDQAAEGQEATQNDNPNDEGQNRDENSAPESSFAFSASFENNEFSAVSITGKAEIIINDAGERILKITEGKWESSIIVEQNTKLRKTMLIPAIIFALIAISGLAIGILSFVFGAKKKKLILLNTKIDNIGKNNEENYKTLQDDLKTAQRRQGGYSVSSADIHVIENRIDELAQSSRNFANTKEMNALSRRIDVLEDDKKTREEIKRGSLDPLEVFNSWAANPVVSLPEAFYYLQGDFRIRVTHALKESANPSKWISNRYGSVKYLLPNPGFFDPMTNISELYAMDMTRLKTKGQNRIRVIKPCEMADNGYVNYPGELQLL